MAKFILNKGYDLNLDGKPNKEIIKISSPDIIKIDPHNFKYIKPKILVKVGDKVKVGTQIFFDKNNPDIKHTSSCSGKVESIDYGAKRKVLSINIKNDKEYNQEELKDLKSLFEVSSINNLSSSSTKAIINEAGLWPTIRQRPFSKIADINEKPKSIFISMKPTEPLSIDQLFFLENNSVGFIEGLDALSNLTDGHLNVVLDSKQDPSSLVNLDKVKIHYFNGPHPSGNIGIHIHHLDPIESKNDAVWYLTIQDVCDIGKLFVNSQINVTKLISMGGPGCVKPCYIEIYKGTPLSHINNELNLGLSDESILISGSVLSGDLIDINSPLMYYHEIFSVLKKSEERHFLGWILPGLNKFTLTNTFVSKLIKSNGKINHSMMNGSKRAIVPIGLWEKVLPMDILPNFLIRSILASDIEDMEKLGIYECHEEDFALCSLICQSKVEVSQIIKNGLDLMYEEG